MEKPGLIVAPLTPFTADLEVDQPALRRQIDYVVRDCRATVDEDGHYSFAVAL